jgi:hypothetical protein
MICEYCLGVQFDADGYCLDCGQYNPEVEGGERRQCCPDSTMESICDEWEKWA